jgi:hypothetical protein
MSGARLVILILGGLAALVGIVLLAFVLFEPEASACASGDLATNPFVNGRYEPRNETFDSVEEAEAFICHDVPELQADGWTLERIAAERTLPLEFLVEGDGLGIVTLGYREDATGRFLTVDAAPFFGRSYFEAQIPPQHTEEDAQVQGLPATLYGFGINPDFVTLIWLDETLEHRATAQLDAGLTREGLLQLLDTLE